MKSSSNERITSEVVASAGRITLEAGAVEALGPIIKRSGAVAGVITIAEASTITGAVVNTMSETLVYAAAK